MHHSRKVKICLLAYLVGCQVWGEPMTWLKRGTTTSFNLIVPVTFSRNVPGDGKVRFRLEPDTGDSHEVVVGPSRVSIVRTGGDGPRELDGRDQPDIRDGRLRTLLIKRRPETISVYIDNTRVLQTILPANDGPRGRAGHTVNSPAVQVGQVRVQPVGAIRFGDGFMRVAGETGQWQLLAGDWSVAGVGLPEFSTNAFCWRGRGQPAACMTGHWFWEDYRVSASVRYSTPGDGCGILVYARDLRNGLLLYWGEGTLSLLHRSDGVDTELTTRPSVLVPDQWYNLSVCAVRGQVVCYLDGALALGPVDCPIEHGRIGLVANGDGGLYFDDVEVDSISEPAAPPLGRQAPVVKASFANDRYMAAWSQRVAGAGRKVLDYTFHRAPTDWLCAAGRWGVQSRWLCQPRWTWFGGTDERAAVIWNKFATTGDVSIEMYAAISMDSVFDPDYKHPGDMNLTICADGENLNSGYTLVFAGWRNRWTRLLRQDEIVLETKAPLLPDNRDSFSYKGVHVPWYHLGLRKKEARIEASLGEQTFFTYVDPKPLSGDRVGIWTWGNRMLLARVAVQADQLAPPDLSHYERKSTDAQQADELSMHVARPGARLRTPLPIAGHDLREAQRLSFDYQASPGFMANVYVELLGQTHCIVFSAPQVEHDCAPVTGRFAAPILDGEWHTAEVDLLAGLATAYAEVDKLVVDNACLDLLSDDHYVLCGFRGNEEELVYRLDNVTLMPAVNGCRPVRVAWSVEPAGSAEGYSYVLDQSTDTEPNDTVNATQPIAEFANLAEGDHVFHVCARRKDGSWTPPEHLRFRVRRPEDTERLSAAVVHPRPGARGLAETTVRLRDNVRVDPASIRLTVNNRMYDLAHPALSYDPGTAALTWQGRATADAAAFADGDSVRCSLLAEDAAGNPLREPLEWKWTVDYALDKDPPEAPYVAYIPSERLCRYTFEEWTPDWGNWCGIQTTRAADTAATGDYSLCLTDMHDSNTLFYALGDVHVPLAKYPWVRFDFRKSTLPTGEAPSVGLCKLFFDGRREVRPLVGPIDAPGRPGEWFNVGFDLSKGHGADAHDPFGILIGGSSGQRGRPGAEMYLDNVVVYSRRGRHPRFEWRAPRDATGISGYGWVLNQNETAVPPTRLTGVEEGVAFSDLAPGAWWFHVRAMDGAGNWGTTRHCGIVIEP